MPGPLPFGVLGRKVSFGKAEGDEVEDGRGTFQRSFSSAALSV